MARYVVKWKSGIQSEINGCFSTSLALERENEATKYRTFPFTIVALKSTDMSQILCHMTDHVTGNPSETSQNVKNPYFFSLVSKNFNSGTSFFSFLKLYCLQHPPHCF